MEVPVGFEPTVIELQSIALPTWLRNQIIRVIHHSKVAAEFQLLFEKMQQSPIVSGYYFMRRREEMCQSCAKGLNFQ